MAPGAFTLSKLPLGLGGRRLLAAGPCGGAAAPGESACGQAYSYKICSNDTSLSG